MLTLLQCEVDLSTMTLLSETAATLSVITTGDLQCLLVLPTVLNLLHPQNTKHKFHTASKKYLGSGPLNQASGSVLVHTYLEQNNNCICSLELKTSNQLS